MSQRQSYFNGNFVADSEARVSVFDSALMFGDMVFEMTRTFKQQPFKLRAHLERLYMSMRLLEIDCGLSLEDMERVTLETLELNKPTEENDMDWQIMHDVSRGPADLYRSIFGGRVQPTVVICCWPMVTHIGGIAEMYKTGVHLAIPSQQAMPAELLDPKAKTRSRLHYQMANMQVARVGKGYWPLLLDSDGFLAEGTGWNAFLVHNGTLYSPEPRNILLGVSRATVIELAAELNIPFVETNLGRYEALQADELFCTSTPFAMLHATSIEGRTIGDGKPGPIYQKIYDRWTQQVGVDFAAQAEDYATRLEDWQQKEAV